MREILFRGKRIDGRGWANGFYISCGGSCILDDDDMFFGADGVEGMYSVDPATVGQYTGLKDRNGVRIFEGDIIKATYRGNYGRYAFEVIFDDGKFALRRDGIVIEMYDGYRPEVIGNIHDNGELIHEK